MAEKKELAVTEEKVVEIEMERLRSFEINCTPCQGHFELV